ncbi:MAG: alpha/beta hydrolase [Halioglobus sp.]|nr:alpha/beta hydrolase [Halioglobus sp.]
MAPNATQRPAEAISWRVNNLQLSGLSWGCTGDKPLLALHGWLDNAASFAFLAPLLTGYHVVALDLTGHGQSDWRSPDASYQIWDDLPEILGVADALGWETFDLIGHSRGAIISTLLASAFPERVGRLVLLDAVVPAAVAESEFPRQMRKALQDKVLLQTRQNRVFPSIEEAVASREERGLPASAARALVERNLSECSGGVTWTTDPRLRGASAVKLSDAHLRAVLSALDMPTLLLLAQQSWTQSQEMAEYAGRHIPRLTVDTIEGGHHFHMEDSVMKVAQRVQQFMTATEECETA